MPRIKLTVAYDGTDFCGWQFQGRADSPDQPRTVQACLEEALLVLTGCAIRVHGAGRTDSGVHAEGQVAHFDLPAHKSAIPLLKALNAVLPKDISVLKVESVGTDFHSRFQAREKVYTYNLWLSEQSVLPVRRNYVWMTGPLDLEKMLAAAEKFKGRHDFSSFRNHGSGVRNTIRVIKEIKCLPRDFQPRAHNLEMVWLIRADGFLKQMVRNIVGCLVAVGRGRLNPDDIPSILAACDRRAAPATAPARGLTLKEVIY